MLRGKAELRVLSGGVLPQLGGQYSIVFPAGHRNLHDDCCVTAAFRGCDLSGAVDNGNQQGALIRYACCHLQRRLQARSQNAAAHI